eukprot:NODE_90_length_21577_cov_0.697691.p3 type:complete len:626 gc:universal NODE_90_length_21577_cov_0.697691:7493-9370(+)
MTTNLSNLFSSDLEIQKQSILSLQTNLESNSDKRKYVKILMHLTLESRQVIRRMAANAIAAIIPTLDISNDFKQLESLAQHFILQTSPACRIAAITIWFTMAKQSKSSHIIDFLYDTISNVALDPSILVREHVYECLSNFTDITESYKLYTIEFRPREREYVNMKGDLRKQIPELSNPGLFGVILQGLEDESVKVRMFALECIGKLCKSSENFTSEVLYLVIDQFGDANHSVRIKASEIFLFVMKSYKLTLFPDDIDPMSKVIRSPLLDLRQNIMNSLKYAKLCSFEDLLDIINSLCYAAQLHTSEKESFMRCANFLGKNNPQLAPRLIAECRNIRETYDLDLISDLIPLAAFFNISEKFCHAYEGEFLVFKSKYPSYLSDKFSDTTLQRYIYSLNKYHFDNDKGILIDVQEQIFENPRNKDSYKFLILIIEMLLDWEGYLEYSNSAIFCYYNCNRVLEIFEVLIKENVSQIDFVSRLFPLKNDISEIRKYEIDFDYKMSSDISPIQMYYCLPNSMDFTVLVPKHFQKLEICCRFSIEDTELKYSPRCRKIKFSGEIEYNFRIPLKFDKPTFGTIIISTTFYCSESFDRHIQHISSVTSSTISEYERSWFPIAERIDHFVIAHPI